MAYWYFVEIDKESMPVWCEMVTESGRTVWRNVLRGATVSYEQGCPLAVAEGVSLDDALSRIPQVIVDLERDLAMERMLDPWSNQGWIAPDGRFWGCQFYQHDELARTAIGKHVRALEDEGWVRVHESSFAHMGWVRGLTKRQETTLIKLGFAVDDPTGSRAPYQPDRSQLPGRHCVRRRNIVLQKPLPISDLDAVEIVEERLRTALGEILPPHAPERILDKDGSWEFALDWGSFSIGSEMTLPELVGCSGLYLRVTSWDTAELLDWHVDGVTLDGSFKDWMRARCSDREPSQISNEFGALRP